MNTNNLNKNEDLVSIIIPTYERVEMLNKALLSVLKQDYQKIEILIVDDNVDDKYSFYIRKMLNNLEDSRIIYLKNKENLGASASRNRGVKAAKGKFISFLDDDDYYLPNNISSKIKTYKASTEDNLGLIYGWTESRDENNRLIKQYKCK